MTLALRLARTLEVLVVTAQLSQERQTREIVQAGLPSATLPSERDQSPQVVVQTQEMPSLF